MISRLALAGLAAVALSGGAAIAQDAQNVHHMNVALPDGSVARIEYVGDTAPKVVVAPVRRIALPVVFADPFARFDSVFAEMDRQMDAMVQQARMLAAQPADGSARIDTVAAGKLPAGTVRYSFYSTSTGEGGCTQSVQYVSDGTGAPKVTRRSSGDCSAMGRAPEKASAPAAAKPATPRAPDPNTV